MVTKMFIGIISISWISSMEERHTSIVIFLQHWTQSTMRHCFLTWEVAEVQSFLKGHSKRVVIGNCTSISRPFIYWVLQGSILCLFLSGELVRDQLECTCGIQKRHPLLNLHHIQLFHCSQDGPVHGWRTAGWRWTLERQICYPGGQRKEMWRVWGDGTASFDWKHIPQLVNSL